MPSCYDQAHIVGSSPALGSLSDTDLSNWGCSVHEAFSSYPAVGVNGFQALVIADGVINDGSQTFADGHTGLPYIVSRGATPIGCGDGKWDASLGEECDDGNTADGDGCSKSCKCESGIAKGDGTCGLALTTRTTTTTETSTTSTTATDTETTTTTATDTETTTTTATETETTSTTATDHVTETDRVTKTYQVTETLTTVSTILSTNVIDKTNTVTATAYTTLTSVVVTSYTAYPTWGSASKPAWMTTPYATPSATSVSCIGIEIIVSATETFQKPIYNTPIPTAPCYVCAMKEQGIPTNKGFITAVTTHGVDPVPATIKPCETCETISMTKTCPWEEKPTFTADHFTIFPPHDHSAMVQGKPVPTPAVSFVASIMAYTTDPSKWSIPTLSSVAVPAATGAGAWGSNGYAAPSTPGAAVPDATATWGGYASSYPSAAPSGVSPATWGGSSNGTSDVWQYTGAAANTKVVGFGTGVMAVLAAALLL